MAKNLISDPILARLAQIWVPENIFCGFYLYLNVRHCCKPSLNATSRKTNDPKSLKWQKTSFCT